jgi:hypothetical protein
MIAVINTAYTCDWAESLSDLPWGLLPVANRPLLDYWLESCAELGVGRVHLVLGDEAKRIEDFCGDGKRWNLEIQYTFARPNEQPLDYLKSVQQECTEGLLYLGRPFFLRRRQAFHSGGYAKLEPCRHGQGNETAFLYATDLESTGALLDGEPGSRAGLEQIHINAQPIDGISSYYELNMQMVRGEFSRYATAGFAAPDGSSIGFNVRTPPSSHLQAPLLIGDDCRFGAMTNIGPNAVIASHVIVDAYSELSNCLILQDTYIGRNLEIENKIVAGNRVISPDDGTVMEIDDSWLVARNRPDMRSEDFVRYCLLWGVAFVLAVFQLLPFVVLFPMIRLTRIARFEPLQFHDPRTGYITLPIFRKLENRRSAFYSAFLALSLDRLPLLLLVLRGRLFLCGQPPMRHPEDDELIKQLPHYYPGVFGYQDYNKESDRLVDSLWYAHIRSLYEDLKILIKALLSRLLRGGR